MGACRRRNLPGRRRHLVFGIEVSVEALLSPTHLLLAAGFLLMLSGPVRAALARTRRLPRRSWRDLAPALWSMTLGYSVLTFFTSYAHPFVDSYAATAFRVGDAFSAARASAGSLPDPLLLQALGVAGILLQTGLLTAVIVAILRTWRPPFGGRDLLISGSLQNAFNKHYATFVGVPNLGRLFLTKLTYSF